MPSDNSTNVFTDDWAGLKAILLGAEEQGSQQLWELEDSLAELRFLALTAGLHSVGVVKQKVKETSVNHYVGRGKVEELVALCEEKQADLVLADDELTPSQLRNLERACGCPIIDRTALILRVFGQRARTHEGQLQVELARYRYLLPRLAGRWTHLERQMGGFGGRGGPGETQLEVDRRIAREKIAELNKKLEGVRAHRAHYRRRRQRAGLPVVALVGYTNAGKSTLFNALTSASVLAENKLFATLDPTTRRLDLGKGQTVLLSDTVGFIQKLPTAVVAAFRATLEELTHADLLLHVLDISHKQAFEQSQAVEQVLREMELAEMPMITVLNKADQVVAGDPNTGALVGEEDLQDTLSHLREEYPNGVLLSATRGWGFAVLLERIAELLKDNWVDVRLLLPWGSEDLAALLHRNGRVERKRFVASGTLLEGSLPRALLPKVKRYAVSRAQAKKLAVERQ